MIESILFRIDAVGMMLDNKFSNCNNINIANDAKSNLGEELIQVKATP
jgi:hypothetical protein